ncbi:MAG: uroporphyrinogen-III synthase [Asticcacaulis sp.]
MTTPQPVVWITRTPEGARRTARAVHLKGYETLISPVLKIQSLKPVLEPHSFDELILTSRNGLNAFCAICSRRAITVWCVGDSTAEAARAKKFQRVISAGGNVRLLTDRIRTDASKHSRMLYAAPREPASTMGTTLRAEGFKITEVALYETQYLLPRFTPDELNRITHILIQSPKAGRAVAEALIAYYDKINLADLTFLCISEAAWNATEKALRTKAQGDALTAIQNYLDTGANRRISSFPDEASMLMLLD